MTSHLNGSEIIIKAEERTIKAYKMACIYFICAFKFFLHNLLQITITILIVIRNYRRRGQKDMESLYNILN